MHWPAGAHRIGESVGPGVYAVDGRVVCKVVVGDRPADVKRGPLRELAIHKLANAVYAAGLTEHVVLLASARLLASETRLFLERFDASASDFVQTGMADDVLRSIAMQALHGYYTMQRELGFDAPDFGAADVLVRRDADVPETWRWRVGRRDLSAPSCGLLACVGGFGRADIAALRGNSRPDGI